MSFVKKTPAEFEVLSEFQKEKYISDKEAHDAAEMQKKIDEGIVKGIAAKFPEQTETEKATALLEKQNAEKRIKELEETIQQFKENVSTTSQKESFENAFMRACKVKADEINEIVKNGGKQERPLFIVVKAVNMTDATTIDAGATQISLTQNTGIISPIRQRVNVYLEGASTGRTNGNHVIWIEETTESGTPIFIAEAAGKTQLSVLYVEKTQTVRKIAVYGKVSTEFLADLPQLLNYVQNNLSKRVNNKMEDGLLLGDGSGVTLYGLDSYKTAFTAGTAAALIDSANYIDVIEAANKQVRLAFGIPNRWYVHPDDMFILKSSKDKVGRPLWKDYMDKNGDVVIGGALLVETPAMTAGSFLGGDTTVANVLFRNDLSIQIGLDGNDFTNNLKTILIEQRLSQFVSANDTQVVVGGTWAAAVAALDKP